MILKKFIAIIRDSEYMIEQILYIGNSIEYLINKIRNNIKFSVYEGCIVDIYKYDKGMFKYKTSFKGIINDNDIHFDAINNYEVRENLHWVEQIKPEIQGE